MATASHYYICNRCRFRTTLFSRINKHILKHTQQLSYFDCFDRLIPLKFRLVRNLSVRRIVRTDDEQRPTLKANRKSCHKCKFHTYSNYLWIRHTTIGACKVKKKSKKEDKKVVVLKKNDKEKKVVVLKKSDPEFYLCEKCGCRVRHKHHLERHMINKHTLPKEIDWQQCTQCPAKFKTLDGLKTHQKRHIVYLWRCSQCDYFTPSKSILNQHVFRIHTPPKEITWMLCHECGAKFKSKVQLNRHLARHPSNRKQYKCDHCDFVTHCKDSLRRHNLLRHSKDDEIKWHKCQHCNYKAKMKQPLIHHIQSKHSGPPKLLECYLCDYKTERRNHLTNHITRSHDDSAFKCDLCNYRAKCEETLEIHKKKKHEKKKAVDEIKLFKCEHCDYTTKANKNLEAHLLVKHNPDGEVFQCKHCEYNSTSEVYLSQHMIKNHKREALIRCESCHFVTRRKKEFERHMLRKHTVDTEEEKFNCDHCSYFCFSKKNLDLHLQVKHQIGENIRWYECDKCDYKSPFKKSLTNHVYKYHNDGKLLECVKCFYKTVSPAAMQSHEISHKKKKWMPNTDCEKFECYICGYTTNQKRFIKNHITRNHSKTKN